MNFQYESALKYARTIASRGNLRLQIEPNGVKCTPRTDGSRIIMPYLDPRWEENSEQFTDWMYALIHECYHNLNTGDFDLLKNDPELFQRKGMRYVHNLVLDYNIENKERGDMPGRDKFVSKARKNFVASFDEDDKSPLHQTKPWPSFVAAIWAVDCELRSTWMPDMQAVDWLGKMSDESLEWVGHLFDREDIIDLWNKVREPIESVELANEILNVFDEHEEEEDAQDQDSGNDGQSGDGGSNGDSQESGNETGDAEGESGEADSGESSGGANSRGESESDGEGVSGDEGDGEEKDNADTEGTGDGSGESGDSEDEGDIESKLTLHVHADDFSGEYKNDPNNEKPNQNMDYEYDEDKINADNYSIEIPQIISLDKKKDAHTMTYSKAVNDEVESSRLTSEIRKLLITQSRARYTGGKKSGRIHGRAMWKSVAYKGTSQENTLYRRKTYATLTDTAVSLLVDGSGSMSGGRYYHAMVAAGLMVDVLQDIGIDTEVQVFTENYTGSLAYMAKEFGEKVKVSEMIRKMAGMETHGMMGGNADADNILLAHERLVHRKNARKILFVISDGYPASRKGIYECYGATKELIDILEEQSPVEIIGLGVESPAVKELYDNYSVISDTKKLEEHLIDVLSNKILEVA